MADAPPLPIDDVMDEIRARLATGRPPRLVVAAPPGAGKTTRIAPALLQDAWTDDGRIILLEPRRLAARLAAERMASVFGEHVGETVGLATRIERKVGARTRIEVVTDGLFVRRLLGDPELAGVAAVLFDEFHERSINLDLALALALDAQSAFRPDLRLVAMSATLDVDAVCGLLDAPAVESVGRAFPVETIHIARDRNTSVVERTAAAVRRALREQDGSILVFLPGAGEIRRVAQRLDAMPASVSVAPLFGAMGPREQDAAVASAGPGRRKVVLATDIAESSLTIDGVSVVVDAGLARIAVHDPATGATRLETRRAARANVDQRRGRAGRLGPGVCYRLWSEPETTGLTPYPSPEILQADLSGLALALAEWGVRDPAALSWIDPPSPRRLAAARETLASLGALDDAGALTARGRAMAATPLAPRQAAMIAAAKSRTEKAAAALLAAVLSEPGLGGPSTDVRERVRRFQADASPRAAAMRRQARRWAGDADVEAFDPFQDDDDFAAVLLAATPGAAARADADRPGRFALTGGGGARLPDGDPLVRARWLIVADRVGAASGGADPRITAAVPVDEALILEALGVVHEDLVRFDVDARSLRARRISRVGSLIITQTPAPPPKGAGAVAALVAAVREHGVDLLKNAAAVHETLARIAFLHHAVGAPWPEMNGATLRDGADVWLAPLFGDRPSLDTPTDDQLRRAVATLLPWPGPADLDALAPRFIEAPSAQRLPATYEGKAARVEAPVQAFFGATSHPRVADGRVPVTVSLLSPAGRPAAVTADLPAFWRTGYADMAKEMRARYPKHDWPDDPATARPHAGRTKRALAADRGERRPS